MGNIYPSQIRSVDPYASYHSNVVNRLTRMISRGENVLHAPNAMEVMADTTSPTDVVIVSKGEAFKDDVYFTITENFEVDFKDPQFYVGSAPFNEEGYYYVLLNYEYVKARPAPKGSITVLKPSERHLYNPERYLFLKAVRVRFIGSSHFEIVSFHDWDPENEDNKRQYAQYYLGVEDQLNFPYDTYRDEGRLVYVRDEDEVYYGMHGNWERLGAIRVVADTTLCEVGQCIYMGLDGKCHPAMATKNASLADGVVLEVGTAHDGNGKVRLYGEVMHVPVETGRTVTKGENVYLSAVEAGKVTDLIPGEFPQFIGTCIAQGDLPGTIKIWLMPSRVVGEGGGSPIDGTGDWYDRYQDLMLASIYKRLTVDAFINLDLVDTSLTTAIIDTTTFHMKGDLGDEFYSKTLSADFDSTAIQHCQLSADATGNILWELSNDGGLTYSPTELNKIHYFAEYAQEITPVSGTFIPGEEIFYQNSNKRATAVWVNGTSEVGVYDVYGLQPFINGELMVGQTSGARATLFNSVDKRYENDLRVRATFLSAGALDDYGVIYEPDQRIVSDHSDNGKNISTLYSDIYTVPSEDNDGLPNLPTPLETCKDALRTFVGSAHDTQTIPAYGSTYYIDSSASLTIAISQLDATIATLSPIGEITNISNFIGKTAPGAVYPTYSSTRNIVQNDNTTAAIGDLDDAIALSTGHYVIPNGDTTPSVMPGGVQQGTLETDNTSSITITQLDDGVSGMLVHLAFGDDNTTVQNNSNIQLKGDVSFSGNVGDILTLKYIGSIWVEIGRSQNNVKSNGWSIINSYHLSIPGEKLILDSGNFNVDLPVNPVLGQAVKFVDGVGNISTRTVYVRRNGQPIMGLAEDMKFDVDGASFDMVFMNATRGWLVVQGS